VALQRIGSTRGGGLSAEIHDTCRPPYSLAISALLTISSSSLASRCACGRAPGLSGSPSREWQLASAARARAPPPRGACAGHHSGFQAGCGPGPSAARGCRRRSARRARACRASPPSLPARRSAGGRSARRRRASSPSPRRSARCRAAGRAADAPGAPRLRGISRGGTSLCALSALHLLLRAAFSTRSLPRIMLFRLALASAPLGKRCSACAFAGRCVARVGVRRGRGSPLAPPTQGLCGGCATIRPLPWSARVIPGASVLGAQGKVDTDR